MPQAVVVVPCYNEERRLDEREIFKLLDGDLAVLLVDDASTDGTAQRLFAIAERAGSRVRVLSLSENGGKGEAVRRGMSDALAHGTTIVGYLDADGSTPSGEALRLLDAMNGRDDLDVVLGSRVQILGAEVRRNRARHYLGRIFATGASMTLDLPVYDTQCGAKFFRDTPALRSALAAPFTSRWAFDVELLGRLLVGARDAAPIPAQRFLEIPLRRWIDVDGSKLRATAMVTSAFELAVIAHKLHRRRRERRRSITMTRHDKDPVVK